MLRPYELRAYTPMTLRTALHSYPGQDSTSATRRSAACITADAEVGYEARGRAGVMIFRAAEEAVQESRRLASALWPGAEGPSRIDDIRELASAGKTLSCSAPSR